jgi:hypothetical protein
LRRARCLDARRDVCVIHKPLESCDPLFQIGIWDLKKD